MKLLKLVIPVFLFCASSVNATVINFQDLADKGGAYGESIWTELNFNLGNTMMTISAGNVNGDGVDGETYVYMDSGKSGLGVCNEKAGYNTHIQVNTQYAGNKANTCKRYSDDNIDEGDYLSFVFSEDSIIEGLTFNNHDIGYIGGTGDIDIFGSIVNASTGGSDSVYIKPVGGWEVFAGIEYRISYVNHKMYLESIHVVPEPSIVALMGLGLFGLFQWNRRRGVLSA